MAILPLATPLQDEDEDQSQEACAAGLVPHPFPPRVISQIDVGYFGGSSYYEFYLPSPRMVPLSIVASDTDELLAYCDGNCTRTEIFAESKIDWDLVAVNGSTGSLVDAAANETNQSSDSSCVLYMPPTDLVPGDRVEVEIRATVREICGLAMDPDTVVTFDARVTRYDEANWEVEVVLDSVDSVSISQAPCTASHASSCELLGPSINPNPLVSASIVESPAQMYDGELRRIRCDALDLDTAFMECGMRVHIPPISNFAQSPLCDDIYYFWSVVRGPGDGTFLYPDRSTLFRATAPGEVTVRVDVTTSNGEQAFSEVTFTILPTQIEWMEFRNHHQLLSDGGVAYNPPEWWDRDGNGTANDITPQPHPNPPLHDQRFPVSYVRGEKVEFGKVKLRGVGGQPAAMPGAHLVGSSTTVAGNQFKGTAHWNALTSEWFCFKLDTVGTLPTTIKKYDRYRIDWQLDFGGGALRALNSTEHRIYVTLDNPADPYGAHESIYDIACEKADGLDSPFLAAIAIWDYVKGRDVHRVGRDGWNRTITPTRLRYWGPGPMGGTPGFLLQFANGQCGSWARFLRALFAVHAIDSAVVNLQVAPNPANTPVNLLVKSWTLPAGNEPLPLQNCTPAGSIPAQGQLSGPPITQNFQDHSIVYVPLFNVVVDPSYGLGPYFGANMLADYEDALLEATVTNINSALGTGDVRRNRVGVPDLIPSFGN